jgi:hypothetical protein
VRLDALAGERQFVDHLAPIWRALPSLVQGDFLVTPELVDHATARGVNPVQIERPSPVPAYPPPRFDGPACLVASYGDVKVGRRIGYGPFAFVEHGCAQTYNGDPHRRPRSGSYSGGGDREDNALFLAPNQQAAEAWQTTYPDARVDVVGSPRLDLLPKREPGPGPVVAISFHWDASSVSPEAGTALGEYLPHLEELAAAFTVIGHAHPKGDWPRVCERYFRRAGIEFVPDFDDVCRRADVYVCDNSSTIYEFASTGRPVVVLNSKHYRKGIHHGLRFWEASHVGFQVDTPDELAIVIRLALVDPPEQQEAREQALDLVYAYRQGGARRAADAIVLWLRERGTQPSEASEPLAVAAR